MGLIDYIPYGRENAVSRFYLSKITGLPDRQLRIEIKKLIRQGNAILSSSSAKGYWRSEDIDEIEEFIRESDHRRTTESLTVDALRRKVANARGYQVVPVKAHFRLLGKRVVSQTQLPGQSHLEE